ncbi:MAG: NUDIX hydrolase [Oscillospiraceae bacterium]|nr:NUDIX hydrolase [Oscillospiraceae bacterium]
MERDRRWLKWAVELQSLAQAGLTYGRDAYDRERYERIREISAEILSHMSDLPMETVRDLFCGETGYQTPKIDTRAAIFQDGKILLVQENDGRWSLPGGWCDVDVSVGENTVKEVREESGLEAAAERVIAVQDRAKHNLPPYAYGVCKIFVLCSVTGGQFQENIETIGYGYFEENDLPELAEEKNNGEQIRMCFQAYRAGEAWRTLLD